MPHPSSQLVSGSESRAESPSRAASPVAAARAVAAVLLVGLALFAWIRIAKEWRRDRPVRQHLIAGMEYARQAMGPQAEAEWKEALRLDPKNVDACRLLADYYVSARGWQRAIVALQRLRALSPKEEMIDGRLAACYLNLGDEVSAFRYSEAEIRRDPNCVPALATSALLLNRMGEKPRAVGYLRRLSRLEPNDPVVLYMLAETLTDTYAYPEARSALQRVIRLDSNNSDAYAELGIGWIDDPSVPDHLQRAEQALRQAIKLSPLNSEARLALGRLYLKENQPHAAIPQLEEAARLMPQNSRPAFELANAFDLAGEPAKAAAMRQRFVSMRETALRVSALQKRTVVNPAVFDYPFELGTIELRRGNYREAYVWLNKARALRPDDRRVAQALHQLSLMTAGPSRMDAIQDQITRASTGSGPAAK